MNKKGLQLHNERGAKTDHATVDQLLEFLESYRLLADPSIEKKPLRLISLKVDPDALKLFRQKCELKGIPYQTKIKSLMIDWLNKSD